MILSRLWVLQGLSDRIAYCVPLLQLGEGEVFLQQLKVTASV